MFPELLILDVPSSGPDLLLKVGEHLLLSARPQVWQDGSRNGGRNDFGHETPVEIESGNVDYVDNKRILVLLSVVLQDSPGSVVVPQVFRFLQVNRVETAVVLHGLASLTPVQNLRNVLFSEL